MSEVPPHTFSTIRSTAKKQKVSINDYLLAVMFQTVKKWNQQQGRVSERIYITVPVSLRSPENRTVSNSLSIFNITFTPEMIEEKEELLKKVRDEIVFSRAMKAERVVNLTGILKPMPMKLIKRNLINSLPKSYPTLTLSNLGLIAPNQEHKDEEGFHCLGPARISHVSCIGYPAPWPQLVILSYNNKMVITLAVARPQLSLASFDQLMDSFIHELTQ
jgi:NRPS condensation-like uncharacterized protein